MENNIRFRNHASVILENSLKTIGTLIFIFIFNIASELGAEDFDVMAILIILGVSLVVLLIILGYQAIIWAKTYISIQDGMLIVECNTLNKKKNTIGLKSISNVNLEQNLFEMLIGTCTLKLDTNSLSTAEETDVKIVLKKKDAEEFRRIVLGQNEEVTEQCQENIQTAEKKEYIGDIGDIILHGLFSLRISSFIILLIVTIAQVGLLQEIGMDSLQEVFAEVIGGLFATLWISVSLVWSMIKEFITYIGFRIERKDDKVLLNYGLFKRVAYSVPVDKINGIRLTQTPLARMGKRYMVEIINVGMDDGENEVNTFFLPYAKIDKIKEQLHLVLPEFDGCTEIKEKKQPPCIWLLWISNVLTYLTGCVLAYAITAEFFPELTEPVIWAAVIVAVWRFIAKIASFLTKGVAVHEQLLKIVDGGFSKRMLFVKYDKIQYVTTKQCVIAKHFGVQKGTLCLLASLKNRIHELPYFKEDELEELKNHLI